MQDLCALRSLLTDLQKAEDDFSKRIGLTLYQASMLCAISHGYSELKQLQKELGLTPSRVTRVADSLEHQGLIERNKATGDRRTVGVALTEEGRKLIAQSGNCAILLPKDIEDLLLSRAKEKTWA
ncbi:MAG: MarR family transcriptional regulator [Candidatus Cloacimonetes bacterium]|nr:MarR family transcriptional regulator [Candidatus Cloacimonadota bacterium]